MSSDPPWSNAGVTAVRHKTPNSLRIIFGFSLAVVILCLHAIVFHPKEFSTVFTVFMIMTSGCILLYLNHSGYRIAWDDQSIYMRPWGFRNLLLQRHPWHSLRYDKMARMWGTTVDRPEPGVTTAMPFQVLEIEAKDDQQRNISLYGSGLNDADLSVLLSHLYRVHAEAMPEELISFMREKGVI